MKIFSRIKNGWKSEMEKTKGMPFRKKAEYFLFYYRFWIAGFIILCCLGGYIAEAAYQSRREVVLQGFFTNDDYGLFEAAKIQSDYTARLNLTENQRVVFDDVMYVALDGSATDYTAASNGKIIAYMATSELDFVVTSREVFEFYAEKAPLIDIRELLPADIAEKLSDEAIIYVEDANGNSLPCGLDMSESRFVKNCGYDGAQGHYVMFVPHLAPHKDMISDFLEYSFYF